MRIAIEKKASGDAKSRALAFWMSRSCWTAIR
jgi:hypothetical protein